MTRFVVFAFSLFFSSLAYSGGSGEVVKFVEMKDGLLKISPSSKEKGFVDIFSTCDENLASIHLEKSRWIVLKAIVLGRDAAWSDLDRFRAAEAYLNSLLDDQKFLFSYIGSSVAALGRCSFRISSLNVIPDGNGKATGVQAFRSYW